MEVIRTSLTSGGFFSLKSCSGTQEAVRYAAVEAAFSHTHHGDPAKQNILKESVMNKSGLSFI